MFIWVELSFGSLGNLLTALYLCLTMLCYSMSNYLFFIRCNL
uniref:Uncharacterized protein n=1 Tax=Arundo donax TaxID=35708 RepID=A0A0A8XXM4_ARUDO